MFQHLPGLVRRHHSRELTQEEPVVHKGKVEILGDSKEYSAIEEHKDGVGIPPTEGDQTLAAIVAELSQAFTYEEGGIDHQQHSCQTKHLI